MLDTVCLLWIIHPSIYAFILYPTFPVQARGVLEPVPAHGGRVPKLNIKH